jgi:hypothetical protein
MTTAIGMTAAALALLGGCHDPYSNALFEEDALFLAAIPDAARVTTRGPGADQGRDDPCDGENWALFPIWTWQTSADLNEMIFSLLYAVEYVAAQPIAERLDRERVWGPVATGDGSAVELRMTRTTDDEGVDRFDYAMTWFDDGADPSTGTVPFLGTFEAGTVPREGVGTFSFDFGLYHQVAPAEGSLDGGQILVEHDNSDGQVLLWIDVVAVTGAGIDEPASARYAFFLDPVDGGGWFEYVWEGDLEGSATSAEERYETRVRWLADGSGRADALLSGGDLEPWDIELLVTECWDACLQLGYYAEIGEEENSIGDPASCVFDDSSLPSHL